MEPLRSANRRRRRASWLLLGLSALPLAAALGASRVEVSAGSVETQGVVARRVEATLSRRGTAGLAVAAAAGQVDGIEAAGRLSNLRLACGDLALSTGLVACRNGRLAVDLAAVGRQDSPLWLEFGAAGRLRGGLPRLAVAGGTADLDFDLREDSWSAAAHVTAVDLGQLVRLGAVAPWLPDGMSVSGRAAGSLRLSGRGPALQLVEFGAFELQQLSFADAAGTLAGELLEIAGTAALRTLPRGAGWSIEAQLRSAAGQAYVDPVFLDLAAQPVELGFGGRLDGEVRFVELDRFSYRQAGVGGAAGSATLDLDGEPLLARARVVLEGIDLAAALPVYARPLLISTQFADIEGAGVLSGEIDIDAGGPSRLALELHDVTLDSTTGALGLVGLAGGLSWFDELRRNELAPQVDSAVFKSRIEWRSARLWGIDIGPASIPFTTTGNHFRLLDPVLIPILDGGLAIETLRLRHAGTPQAYLRFDAELRPVSVVLIARALGWPEFSGSLSGRIPKLELADGFVTLGGNIEAQVFDGTVTIRDLRMRDPLGPHPELFANVDLDRLDLERITSTFEFGMITGRLSGRVESLAMFDWAPVSFDARFYTTPGDATPQRISQRAVSNLSRIGGGSGGGVAAALQSGFLQFFDDFRYKRLGLSCRLADDICRMDGVEPAGTGYYIVEGSGLPRIDVIGNQRRVAWTRLVRQLGAITQSAGPVIE